MRTMDLDCQGVCYGVPTGGGLAGLREELEAVTPPDSRAGVMESYDALVEQDDVRKEMVKTVQRYLRDNWSYRGTIDGLWGPQSEESYLRKFPDQVGRLTRLVDLVALARDSGGAVPISRALAAGISRDEYLVRIGGTTGDGVTDEDWAEGEGWGTEEEAETTSEEPPPIPTPILLARRPQVSLVPMLLRPGDEAGTDEPEVIDGEETEPVDVGGEEGGDELYQEPPPPPTDEGRNTGKIVAYVAIAGGLALVGAAVVIAMRRKWAYTGLQEITRPTRPVTFRVEGGWSLRRGPLTARYDPRSQTIIFREYRRRKTWSWPAETMFRRTWDEAMRAEAPARRLVKYRSLRRGA